MALTPRSAANLERSGKFVRQQRLVSFYLHDSTTIYALHPLHTSKNNLLFLAGYYLKRQNAGLTLCLPGIDLILL